jgi:PadR family transcriptional regulator, regulatory protein PadR
MSKKDILYRCTTQQHGEKPQMTNNYQKEIQAKLTKGLLDLIILQFLNQEPMHGYQLITKIRKNFGIYFGPSTVYPLLCTLEKKGHVKSTWNMDAERPRKIYQITHEGENALSFTEGSLNLLCKNISNDNRIRIEAAPLSSKGSFSKKPARFAIL